VVARRRRIDTSDRLPRVKSFGRRRWRMLMVEVRRRMRDLCSMFVNEDDVANDDDIIYMDCGLCK